MRVRQFIDEGLGNSAHLVISERDGVAALIDPLRDVDQYQEAARREGVRITLVLETHIHNDFLSGSRELAALTGARIVASADAGLELRPSARARRRHRDHRRRRHHRAGYARSRTRACELSCARHQSPAGRGSVVQQLELAGRRGITH